VHPALERLARRLVERANDLVDLHRILRGGPRERVAVLERLRTALARSQLHVGLPEERLRPQQHARVARDRRVRLLELDRGQRAAVHELLVHDLAYVDAGHAHVGLLDEQRGLVEGRLEAVLLGPQRDRPAELEPEHHQQGDDRQDEARHGRELHECRRLLDHPVGQRSESASSSRMPSASSTSGADDSNWSRYCW
jgi:hypothetical protein